MYPLHAIVIPVITAAKCPRTDCCILGGGIKLSKSISLRNFESKFLIFLLKQKHFRYNYFLLSILYRYLSSKFKCYTCLIKN